MALPYRADWPETMAGSDDSAPARLGVDILAKIENFPGCKAQSELRQTDQLIADAARIAFCYPAQTKREPES